MAVNPGFMSFLQGGSSGGGGTSPGVTSQTKKNPYAQAQPVRSSTSGPTPGNSPVTATGSINPNNPPKPQPSPNQMVTQAQTPPPTPDPFAAMGGGNYNPATGGWTPKNMGQPAGQTGGTAPGQPATVPGLPAPGYMQHLSGVAAYGGTNLGQHQNIAYDPTQATMTMPEMYGPYQNFTPQTQLPTQGYQAGNFGNTPFSQYQGNPGNISQFSAPQNQQVQAQQQALLMSVLNNPLTMSDQNVQQLKAQQRATALAQQQAGQSQNAEQMAAMGRVGSGQQTLNDNLLRDQANSNVMSGYRDIALQKMLQDRKDITGAIDTATGVMDSQSQRATSEFNSQLAGQQAREKVGLDAATSAQAAERLGLDRVGMQEDANFRQAQNAQDLAKLGLTRDEMLQKENQFAFGTQQQQFLDQLKANQLGLDVTKFNAGENWNAAQSAQTNQQQALARAIAQTEDARGASDSGMKLGSLLQDSWNNQMNRDQQAALAKEGFGLDRDKMAQTGNLAKMDNSTRLLDIMLGHQRGMAGLSQNDAQFNKTFGLQSQDQANKLMQWLIGQI